jgi:hypothetical protein
MSDEARVNDPVAEERVRPRRRRRWKSILLELLLWSAVAIATAVFLVYAAERWLPSNF